jgi:hypothetical protein
MSTRKLIVVALVTGLVILLAGAVQFIQIARNHGSSGGSPATSSAPLSTPR